MMLRLEYSPSEEGVAGSLHGFCQSGISLPDRYQDVKDKDRSKAKIEHV